MKSLPKADNNNELLIEQIYNYFINLFMEQKLAPGALIEKKVIAKELHVSVDPVGRALARLADEGFVKILPQKGTFVETVRIDFIVDKLVMRLAIECQAARIYCGAAVEKNFDALLPLARALDRTLPGDREFWKKDDELHSALIHLTESKSLINGYEKIAQLGLFGWLNCFFEHPSSENHEKLLVGLLDPDPNRAEELIRSHLHSGKPSVINNSPVGDKNWSTV